VGGRKALESAGKLPFPANATGEGTPYRLMVTHNPNTDWVSTYIRDQGYWELLDVGDIGGLIDAPARASPGVLLDVGANIGFYMLLFAHTGWAVIAIEAMRVNRMAIETTLCLNPDLRTRVTLVAAVVGNPAAGSNESCIVRSQYKRNVGDGTLTCGPGLGCGGGPAWKRKLTCDEVKLSTIDNLLADLKPRAIDVFKMDIEGAECNALAGGQSIFTKYRPALVQLELKQRHVNTCFHEQAALHHYRVGPKRGQDENAVMASS
jgi:FkbM family methyltransferase